MRALSVVLLSAVMMAQAPPGGAIKFEDATAASGIQFTHSFGSQKLGSLLEGTGGGCVWFDYNNDGKPDLYATSGRPLEAGIHPYPLKQQPENPPHNHLFRNDGNGKFTDVTDQAGVAANIYGMAAIAADYDNDGRQDLFVTGYGKAILYHNKGAAAEQRRRHLRGCHRESGHQGQWLVDQLDMVGLRQGWLRRFVCRAVCQVRSQVPCILCGRQLSRAARL